MDRRILGFIGGEDVLRVELRGIKQALKLAKERRWDAVDVESDSLLAVHLINDMGEVNHHPERALIEDCRLLKEKTGAQSYAISCEKPTSVQISWPSREDHKGSYT